MPRSKRTNAAAITCWLWPISSSVMVCALPQAAWAESLPASVQACTAETDSLKRLTCFDREVARYVVQPSAGNATPGSAASPRSSAAADDSRARGANPEPTAEVAQRASIKEGANPDDQQGKTQPGALEPKHIKAHVVRVENRPDDVVIHLDNDEVWEQAQSGADDLNLQTGEAVTIDKQLGSYWLAGRSGRAMKVKRKE